MAKKNIANNLDKALQEDAAAGKLSLGFFLTPQFIIITVVFLFLMYQLGYIEVYKQVLFNS